MRSEGPLDTATAKMVVEGVKLTLWNVPAICSLQVWAGAVNICNGFLV